jgi:hypothetical protein
VGGLYEVTPDDQPIMGRVAAIDGLYVWGSTTSSESA